MQQSSMIIDMEKTGSLLRGYALRNGYTVRDIQDYLGLTCPQSIYKWYKGKALPSVDNLLKLSNLFHVHMDELIVSIPNRRKNSCEYVSHHSTHHLLAYYKRLTA